MIPGEHTLVFFQESRERLSYHLTGQCAHPSRLFEFSLIKVTSSSSSTGSTIALLLNSWFVVDHPFLAWQYSIRAQPPDFPAAPLLHNL